MNFQMTAVDNRDLVKQLNDMNRCCWLIQFRSGYSLFFSRNGLRMTGNQLAISYYWIRGKAMRTRNMEKGGDVKA